MATWVTPHARSQSASASRSRVIVPNCRFSFRFFPFPSAHNTQAVTPFLCTSNPQQHACSTSITRLLSPPSEGRCISEKFLPVPSTSRRRRHFVVPLRVQVIFVLGLFRARIARPSVRFAVVYHLTLGSSPFSCFVVALKAPWFIRTLGSLPASVMLLIATDT